MKSEPGMRRSVTMPTRAAEHTTQRRSSVIPTPEPQIETLFKHPSVRIVSFMTTSVPTNRHNSKNAQGLDEEVGTLSWTSPLERLMAVGMDFQFPFEAITFSPRLTISLLGPLSIYKAPGSVAFLSCVNVMHPILPKSQCWCVDDSSSKFVLQIRRPNYWRIEVPIVSPDDQRASEGLKEVLSQVLLFEKTPCPFKRSFTVELPEAPTTPVKKRPWRPVHTPKSQMDETNLAEAPLKIENGEENYPAVSDNNIDHQGMDSDSDAADDTDATPRNKFHRDVLAPLGNQDMVNESLVLRAGRSVTAPPQLKIITSSPSKDESTMSPLSRSRSIESISSDYSSSVESFHTVQSWHSPITPLPPSPPQSNPSSPTTYPYPHDNISLPKRPMHSREISEITITPESPRVWEISRGSSTESVRRVKEPISTPPPKTPTKVNEFEDGLNEEYFEIAPPPSQQQIRHRPTTGSNYRRRALSPLPPAANIFSPSRRRPRHLQTARHLPTAIIQKTWEILLSPPSHLVKLMLNIAAKIAAGEWRGMVSGFEGGETIAGQWDYEDDELTGDSWDVDDYGISVGGKQPSNCNAARERVGRSWELD
jgi:hypothetical protein